MTLKLGIASAKGGVGKTTVAICLGHALTEFGREVIAVDADLRRPNMGLILGYEQTPKCVHSALAGEHHISECMYMHPCGLRIIPGDTYHDGKYQEGSYTRFYEMLMEFHNKTEVIIVDTPPGIDTLQKNVFAGLDRVIIVTTPHKVSLHDALKTIQIVRESGVMISGVVVNKASEHEDEVEIAHIEHYLGVPVIGVIPYSKDVLEAQKHKYPVTFANVNCPASIAFKQLAANLIGEKYVPDVEKTEKPWDDILKRVGLKD